MTYDVGIFVSFLKKMRMLLYKFFEIFEILAIILISFTKNPGAFSWKFGRGAYFKIAYFLSRIFGPKIVIYLRKIAYFGVWRIYFKFAKFYERVFWRMTYFFKFGPLCVNLGYVGVDFRPLGVDFLTHKVGFEPFGEKKGSTHSGTLDFEPLWVNFRPLRVDLGIRELILDL